MKAATLEILPTRAVLC